MDIDLASFFDEVNHDLLMARVRRRVKDVRMLQLIRAFLRSGVSQPSEKGTPQGGPLPPLLTNILFDDLDRELEKRGHAFCRYAEDCNMHAAFPVKTFAAMGLINLLDTLNACANSSS